MRERVAYFEIEGKQFGDVNHSLQCTFDVTYMGNSLVPMPAHFSITNLKKDDLYAITTNTQLFEERHRNIKFYCGYKDNYQKIFDGRIDMAKPSGQPDTSLDITAWTSTYIMGENSKWERPKTTYLELLNEAALACDLILDIPVHLKKSPELTQTVENFSQTGSSYELLRRVMSDITGFNLVKDQLLFVVHNGILSVSRDNEVNNEKPIIEINSSTGLIGIPEPHSVGIDLRMLMDVSLVPGQTIKLTSKLLPLYDGLYNIFSVTHHGSLRGNDFYSDLYCLKVGRTVE